MSGIAARLPLILNELRVPPLKRLWAALAEQANKEGWPAERFLAAVMEHKLAERETRRLERHRSNPSCCPASCSRALTSLLCQRCRKTTSPPWLRTTVG